MLQNLQTPKLLQQYFADYFFKDKYLKFASM